MALFNIFKKFKKEKKPSVKSKTKPIKEKKKETSIEKPIKIKSPKVKISGLACQSLKTPHITEKVTELTKKNQYTFKVLKRTNKIEIKKAIKDLYNVDVEKVRIINVPRRKTRLGRIEGWKTGYKKAIVELKKGQKIEVLPR